MGSKAPHDQLGNELHIDDFVTFTAGQPIIYKVIAVQEGGLHIGQGVAPSSVRILADMTVGCQPGGRIPQLLRVVNPES